MRKMTNESNDLDQRTKQIEREREREREREVEIETEKERERVNNSLRLRYSELFP